MSRRVEGALMSYGLVMVRLVVALTYTPVLVSTLGQEQYGLFALVGALAAYLYLLDFGMNDSVLRFFVTHENEPAHRDAFLSRMLIFYGVIGIATVAMTLILASWLEPFFGATMAPEQIESLRLMLLVAGTGAAVLVALNPVMALISAAERFVFLRGIEMAGAIITAVVSVILLNKGFDALAVVVLMTGMTIAQVLLRCVYAVAVLEVRPRWLLPEPSELRDVAQYAAPIFVSMIAGVVFWRLDPVLIGMMLGAAPIAIYSIGVTFNKYLMSFATSLSRVMTPEIVRRIDAGADAKMLTDLMIRISRLQALVLLLILGGLIVFGERFLVLWLGPDYERSYWIMLMVLVPYTLELTGNARNIVLQVRRLYWQKSAISLGMAAINIPLTIMLLRHWGVVGAAASTGLSIILGYLMIAVLLQRRVGVLMGRYWRETSRGILPVMLILTGVGLFLEPYLPGGWGAFLLGAGLFSLVYIGAMALFVVNVEERALFQQVLAKLRLRRVSKA